MSTYTYGADCPPPLAHRDLGRLAERRRGKKMAAMAAMADAEPGDRDRRRGRGRGPWGPPADLPTDLLADGWPGRGPRRPRGGRRGRAMRGDVRLAVLALLAEGPRHGYQLIQDITERSQGAWAPSPGAVYPALSAMQDEGLVDDEKLDGRRVFSLTDAGRDEVARRSEDLARVFVNNAGGPEQDDLVDLRDLVQGIGMAAMAVHASGTPQQREQARVILSRDRRDLYRLLADDAPDPDAADTSAR